MLKLKERYMHWSFIQQSQPMLLIGGGVGGKTSKPKQMISGPSLTEVFIPFHWGFGSLKTKIFAPAPILPDGVHSEYIFPFMFSHRPTCFP